MERCSAKGDQPPAFAGGFPEPVHAERIRENFDLFDFQLTEDKMARLAVVDTASPMIGKPKDPTLAETAMTG